MKEFSDLNKELFSLIQVWEKKLTGLSDLKITVPRNEQNRNIKQILGHMIDSASNNIHRIVHLQYQSSPFEFPNYATHGNNDRWIAIQNYENESWDNIIQLWKYINLHIIHIVENVDSDKLENRWISGINQELSLKDMIIDYLPHFKLHLDEIEELIKF